MKQNAWLSQDLKTKGKHPNSTLQQIQTQISPYSESPYLDALVLLSHITAQSKSQILAHPSPDLTPEQELELNHALIQIKEGIPLPYILGIWEFYQLDFTLTPDVLIPRPETEGLVQRAHNWLEEHPGKRTCLDLGTGSGCIAVSLALNIPDLRVFATDVSIPTLQVAKKNATHHQTIERISFLAVDLLSDFRGQVDLLIANLPYIPRDKLNNLRVVHTEPRLALDGGPDGLSYIKRVLEGAPAVMNPGGLILLELDETRGQEVLEIARSVFPRAEIQLEQDLSGQDRYLTVQTR